MKSPIKLKRIRQLNEKILFIYLNLDIENWNAITLGNWVFAEMDDIDDKSLVAHELVHENQYDKWGWMFIPVYLLSKHMRLRFEAEAYAAQAMTEQNKKLRDIKVALYANILSKNYRLGVTPEQAKQEILKWMN